MEVRESRPVTWSGPTIAALGIIRVRCKVEPPFQQLMFHIKSNRKIYQIKIK